MTVKIYSVPGYQLNPPAKSYFPCDVVLHYDYQLLEDKLKMINGLADAGMQANTLATEATEALIKERDALALENSKLKASQEILAKNILESCNEVFCAGFRNESLQRGFMASTGNRNTYPNPLKSMVDEAIRVSNEASGL